MKVTDVPFAQPTRGRDYRSYRLKFQAPPGTGIFTWRVIVVSDTYIGEDAVKDLQVCLYLIHYLTLFVGADVRLVTGGRVYSADCGGAA
jgi:hypothetical protein